MTRLKKYLILLIITIIGFATYLYYDAFHLAPSRLTIRYETIIDQKIPESFSDTQILFISDIYFNNFMDVKRLDIIIGSINKIEPDIVIFLGDLFDKPLTNSPSATTQEDLSKLLKMIQAPLGKFAIYGDQDLQSVITKQIFDTIMRDADFEILSDEKIKLARKTHEAISLIAVNNIINGKAELEQAFLDIVHSDFNLVISHAPDIIDAITIYKPDLMLSGHSLGQQFNLPLINKFTTMNGAKKYYNGKTKVAQTLLDITNGLGTTGYDARLFSDPEVVVYLFRHQ